MYYLLDRNDPRFQKEVFKYVNEMSLENRSSFTTTEARYDVEFNWNKFLSNYVPLVFYENEDRAGDSIAFILYRYYTEPQCSIFHKATKFVGVKYIWIRFHGSRYWKNPELLFQALRDDVQQRFPEAESILIHWNKQYDCFNSKTWDDVRQCMKNVGYEFLRAFRFVVPLPTEVPGYTDFDIQEVNAQILHSLFPVWDKEYYNKLFLSRFVKILFRLNGHEYIQIALMSILDPWLSSSIEWEAGVVIDRLWNIDSDEDARQCIEVINEYVQKNAKLKYRLIYTDYHYAEENTWSNILGMAFSLPLKEGY